MTNTEAYKVDATNRAKIFLCDLTHIRDASRVHKSVPLGRACSQSEVAKACWALCSGAMPYVSGQTIVMDGGSMVLEPFGITGR